VVRGLLVEHVGRRSALVVLMMGALVGGCGGDDPDPKADVTERVQKRATSAATGVDKRQPAGPSQADLALDYQRRVERFSKKYRSQRKTLIHGFKNAKTPAAYIAVAKKYKRYLNRSAHSLAVMKPPRPVRRYHQRLIVIIRRLNGHMSIAIGGVKQLNLQKLNRFDMLINRDIEKGDKAAKTIDRRMRELTAG
jgi:hypothetical protein